MPVNDDDIQLKRIDDLKKREEEDLIQILADSKYGLPYINLTDTAIDGSALRYVEENVARKNELAPFKILGKNIYVACFSPEKDGVKSVITDLEEKGLTVFLYMASHKSLEKVWQRYGEVSFAKESRTGSLDISPETLDSFGKRIEHVGDIKNLLDEVSRDKVHKISLMLEVILAGAIATGASDVHIEPEETNIRLRYRLDGALQDVLFFSGDVFRLLSSRIKLLSGLKLTLKSIAQDGRFSIFTQGTEINIRTSVIPGAYGESIVMRLLDPRSIRVKLEEMGIDKKLFEVITKTIKKPNGLVLLTGPTGSGKTTTLYAFLQRIYSPDIKIITIEDPIEYHLAGITQTQTDPEKGYTFLEGLRSALRQDPDVIMVGEIRDDETAKIAVESALTGHLVFSTLHTNNAAGVIPRLIDLGVNPKTIPSALSLSIAQRLVRKVCDNCKKTKENADEEKEIIRKILRDAVSEGKDLSYYNVTPEMDFVLYEAVGCEKCNNTGYRGRIGIFEAIEASDPELEKIIPENPSEREIKQIADKKGLIDMKEDGAIKIINGLTTLEEVRSVVDIEED